MANLAKQNRKKNIGFVKSNPKIVKQMCVSAMIICKFGYFSVVLRKFDEQTDQLANQLTNQPMDRAS